MYRFRFKIMSDYVWIFVNNLTNNPPQEVDLSFGKVTDDNVQI